MKILDRSFDMKIRYLGLSLILLGLSHFNSYAANTYDIYGSRFPTDETQIESTMEGTKATYDENLSFEGNPGTTYRYEVFYDRNFPDIYFCIQNDTNIKYEAKDMEEDTDGTSIEIRSVESISGQNFSVIYFTCGVEGTYTIEYSESDCFTFVLAETEVNENYKTMLREKRLPVQRVFYDIVGPYTEVSLDTLLDPEYDPLSSEAEILIQDEVVDNTIYIPINIFTVSIIVIIFLLIIFYNARKRYLKLKSIEENIVHKDLLDSITSSQIADEEQNEELKDYWNIIKNDYVDI